jgi:hypothetical protein
MKDVFEVRDYRNKSMFRVDDEYLNGYAKLCGINATMVYLCLCRHADRNQESFPSIKLMAEKTGVSERSVIRGIQILIEWNIISKERERKKDAKWLNNRYILLDKNVWKSKPSATQSLGSQVTETTEPSATDDKSQVPHSHTKVTHIKVTHTNPDLQSDGVNLIIDAFKSVNPSYKLWFARKPQRDAVKRLIETHGNEQLLKVIPLLKKTNTMKYFPNIQTPIQLEEKWSSLENAFLKQKQNYQGRGLAQ